MTCSYSFLCMADFYTLARCLYTVRLKLHTLMKVLHRSLFLAERQAGYLPFLKTTNVPDRSIREEGKKKKLSISDSWKMDPAAAAAVAMSFAIGPLPSLLTHFLPPYSRVIGLSALISSYWCSFVCLLSQSGLFPSMIPFSLLLTCSMKLVTYCASTMSKSPSCALEGEMNLVRHGQTRNSEQWLLDLAWQ